jgi:hypothetical protein
VTDDTPKPIPCPKGARYFSTVVPRPPPQHRELTPEERAARKAASERAASAAAALHVQLLAEGMELWLARAREKFLRAGGYGCRLTPEEESEIRAAGFEPKPPDR